MLLVELKPLFARLNGYSTQALENAAGLCLARTHYEITPEHLLLRLLDDASADVGRILTYFAVDPAALKQSLEATLSMLKSGNGGRPTFTPLLSEWVQEAWLAASVTLGESRIRSGALLLALITRLSYYAAGTRYIETLRPISRETLSEEFGDLVVGSLETSTVLRDDVVAGDGSVSQAAQAGSDAAITRFCEDFTAKAATGKIDPVFGRDDEIRQMVDILARRRKNNPITVGEPGVGKTAVVEGLALRIVENDVPDFLKGTRLLGLDLGLLEAGASVKGEFENRLKSVISEIKASTRPIILFIDEAHMMVGGGGQAGGSDAANLLKPALARGELRTIAATTWSEYKKYFEKDPALARRFQLVKLDEPSAETTVQILRGLKEKYESVHGVSVRDDAIVAAAELSDRYITGRQLPDKAVDLLDTACARVKISLGIKPGPVELIEHQLAGLAREHSALTRDNEHGHPVDAQRLTAIELERGQLDEELASLTSRWQQEQQAAAAVIAQWQALLSGQGTREDLQAACRVLADLQGDTPLVFTEVGPDAVAQVVSDWTGVPLGRVLRDEAAGVLTLADSMKERIKGQDHALEQIAEMLKSAKSGLKDPEQPLGVFLLVGPSGVGKTETALTVADQLFGGEQARVSINMSEFQEKHSVSRLVGSPPGYVGYGEGGVLTEAVRQRPYSVVLLDEVEKAHLDVVNLFYQVFDKGVLCDGEGREIDFSNTVLFLTSNLASEEISAFCAEHEGALDVDALSARIRPILARHFKPALLARITVVPFLSLPQSALSGIVRLKLAKVSERLAQSHKASLDFSEAVVDTIAQRCTEVDSGARNIDFILKKQLLPKLSNALLGALAQEQTLAAVTVDVDAQGEWQVVVTAA